MNSSSFRQLMRERFLFQSDVFAVHVVRVHESWRVWFVRLVIGAVVLKYEPYFVQYLLEPEIQQPQSLVQIVAVSGKFFA